MGLIDNDSHTSIAHERSLTGGTCIRRERSVLAEYDSLTDCYRLGPGTVRERAGMLPGQGSDVRGT